MKLRVLSTSSLIRPSIAYVMLIAMTLSVLPVALLANDPNIPPIDEISSPATTKSSNFKMWPTSFAELKAKSMDSQSTVETAKAADDKGAVYYAVGVEFKSAAERRKVFSDLKASTLQYIYVITAIDRFADVFIEAESAYTALKAHPAVVRVEMMSTVSAPPPPDVSPSTVQVQGERENIIRGGYQGLTGKNVIVAVVDTGIDFRHPDFINYDAQGRPTSRIKYLWDTGTAFQKGVGSVSPLKFPNGGSIGTLYTQAQLTAELRSSTSVIPPTDWQGHGTACASIAAGNGNADKRTAGLKRKDVEGVAPEADIIGVAMGPKGTFRNGYLLGGIMEWLDKTASKTPLVVSGSFGGHYTGHDGQTVKERHLNARFPLTQAGRAVVIAAGNEGSDGIHSKLNFSKGFKTVNWFAEKETELRIYFDGSDKFTVQGTPTTSVGGDRSSWDFNPFTNQWALTIKIAAGQGSIKIENPSGRDSEAHLYFYGDEYGTFAPANVTASHLVGSPGSAENAITVGSYDWNNSFHTAGVLRDMNDPFGKPITVGWLSTYSSRGPLRPFAGKKPTFKPEIVSPGQYYTSAAAKVNGVSVARSTDTTGDYRLMNGTSAATPYTSGVIALMFQKKAGLTLGQIRELLTTSTTKAGLHPLSEALPNIEWGYGKLDVAAIDRVFAGIK